MVVSLGVGREKGVTVAWIYLISSTMHFPFLQALVLTRNRKKYLGAPVNYCIMTSHPKFSCLKQ